MCERVKRLSHFHLIRLMPMQYVNEIQTPDCPLYCPLCRSPPLVSTTFAPLVSTSFSLFNVSTLLVRRSVTLPFGFLFGLLVSSGLSPWGWIMDWFRTAPQGPRQNLGVCVFGGSNFQGTSKEKPRFCWALPFLTKGDNGSNILEGSSWAQKEFRPPK